MSEMTRLFTIWHMHLGPFGDPKAMSVIEIKCAPLWFWADQARAALEPKP